MCKMSLIKPLMSSFGEAGFLCFVQFVACFTFCLATPLTAICGEKTTRCEGIKDQTRDNCKVY